MSAPEINCVNEDAEIFSRHLLFLAWRSHLEDAQPNPFSEVRTKTAFKRVSWYLPRSLAKIRGAPLQNARKVCNLQIAANWTFLGIRLEDPPKRSSVFRRKMIFTHFEIFAQKFPSMCGMFTPSFFHLSPYVLCKLQPIAFAHFARCIMNQPGIMTQTLEFVSFHEDQRGKLGGTRLA